MGAVERAVGCIDGIGCILCIAGIVVIGYIGCIGCIVGGEGGETASPQIIHAQVNSSCGTVDALYRC